eukprot:8948700-Lingulodinium_polyedra.AAC.1
MSFCAQRSDMDIADLKRVMAIDTDAPLLLASFETQIPPTLSWPVQCKSKEVTFRWMNERGDRFGSRLQKFKGEGGISDEGEVDWSHGCYRLEWSSDNKLSKIKHASGDEATVDSANIVISREN